MRALATMMLLLGCREAAPPKQREPIPLPPVVVDAPPPIDAAVTIDAAPPPVDPGAAAKAAYPELLDLRTRWIYDVVEGRSPAKLRRVKGAPRIFGTMDVPTVEDGYTIVHMNTRPEGGRIAMELASTTNRRFRITYDEDGIRQLAALLDPPSIKGSIRGFTFPTTVDGPVTVTRDARFGRVKIRISKQTMTVAKQERAVLAARTEIEEKRYNATSFELFAYAPGLGPALLCTEAFARDDLLCLQLVEIDERRCAVAASQLCAGKDAATCDAILMKLLVDPADGKPQQSSGAEKRCDGYLQSAAEMERLKSIVDQR